MFEPPRNTQCIRTPPAKAEDANYGLRGLCALSDAHVVAMAATSSTTPALAANMTRLTAHMRELYIHTLATALTERVSGAAGCNWEVPFSKVRGGLSKLCYECEPADDCLLYTSPSPRDGLLSRMPSSA